MKAIKDIALLNSLLQFIIGIECLVVLGKYQIQRRLDLFVMIQGGVGKLNLLYSEEHVLVTDDLKQNPLVRGHCEV